MATGGGKLFAHTPSQIKTIYGARLDRFKEVHSRVDPGRKFTNAWLDRMVLDSEYYAQYKVGSELYRHSIKWVPNSIGTV